MVRLNMINVDSIRYFTRIHILYNDDNTNKTPSNTLISEVTKDISNKNQTQSTNSQTASIAQTKRDSGHNNHLSQTQSLNNKKVIREESIDSCSNLINNKNTLNNKGYYIQEIICYIDRYYKKYDMKMFAISMSTKILVEDISRHLDLGESIDEIKQIVDNKFIGNWDKSDPFSAIVAQNILK